MSLAITTDFELGAGVGLHGGDTYFRGKKKCKLKIRKKISNFGKIHKSLEARKLIFKNRLKRYFFFRSAHSKAHGNSIHSELHRKPTTGYFF
jgi:hypothetical protein